MLATLLVLSLPGWPQEPSRLAVGKTLEGEITDAAAVVHTPTLDEGFTDAPAIGKSYSIEIEEPGFYTIELRSYFFDAYLVLRDRVGNVLAEDDDGGIGLHARISTELELGVSYRLEACALHGERGPFELELGKGKPPALSPAAQRAAERADLERTVAIRESTLGPGHPASATSIDNLARFLRAQGDYAAARPLYERALAIRERALGPEHPDTAQSLNNLAGLLWATGDAAAAEPHLRRALAINEKALGPEH